MTSLLRVCFVVTSVLQSVDEEEVSIPLICLFTFYFLVQQIENTVHYQISFSKTFVCWYSLVYVHVALVE